MIQTILGRVPKESFNYVLGHEHLVMNLSHIRKETDSILEDVGTMIDELLLAKSSGLTGVIDVSNIGMGRDINKLVEIAKATGLKVIASTGYYQDIYYTPKVRTLTADEISKKFIKELNYGIDDTKCLASVIGEIGSSYEQITETEQKVFKAAALACKKTGAPIFTHCEQGTMALEQVKLLLGSGVTVDKILIGHMDLVENINYLKRVLETGVAIAFDTIGKTGYVSDELRAKNIFKLIELGYENKIILSLDITRKSYLKCNGGHGYNYMFESFIPRLKALGISDSVIRKLLRDNVLTLLEKLII